MGVPVKLLHEATGHICTVRGGNGGWHAEGCVYHGSPPPPATAAHRRRRAAQRCLQVELKSGEIYRGELHEAEDNWNLQLANVTATGRDGKVAHMEHIFIRGSRVRFVVVPDMLKNAPMVR